MDMDLKSILDFLYLDGKGVDESYNYVVQRLGPHVINRDEMQYWHDFYRRMKTVGRRCRCLNTHSLNRSTCTSALYCCEKPFELNGENLVVSDIPMKPICDWEVTYPTDYHGAFYPRSEKEKSCTIDARFIVQHMNTLSSFKLFDLYHKKSMPLEYKETKLAILSKTRLQTKASVRISEFQMVSSDLGIALVRSNDYFENMHHQNFRNGMRPFASALCLTEINIDRGTFKFIDAFVLEDANLSLYNSYDRFNTLIGAKFKVNEPLGLIVCQGPDQKFLPYRVVNERLQVGEVIEILPVDPQRAAEELERDREVGIMFIQDRRHQALMQIDLLNIGRHEFRQEFRRNRRRNPVLTMHTCTDRRFYGFEYEPQPVSTVGFYGNRHVKLLLGRILVYDLELKTWDDIKLETPFTENSVFVLNHLSMVWKWVGHNLYCAAELEPNRIFILSFNLNTLRWTKMNLYFLNQVYNIVTDYNGAVLVETRHKVIYGGRFFDPIRRNIQDEPQDIKEDGKVYTFYRLSVGHTQSLLTMAFLMCRKLKEEDPNSEAAQLFDTMIFNKSHACPSKLKRIPVPSTPIRSRRTGLPVGFGRANRNPPVRDIPPLRRSARLRNARQNARQNPRQRNA